MRMTDSGLYSVSSSYNYSTKNITFTYYNYDFNLTEKVKKTATLSSNNSIYQKGYYCLDSLCYIFESNTTENKQSIILYNIQNNTVEKKNIFDGYGDSNDNIYYINNKIYFVKNEQANSAYTAKIYSISTTGEVTLIKSINNMKIRSLQQDEGTNIAAVGYSYVGTTSNGYMVKILNNKFEELKSKNLSTELGNGNGITSNLGITSTSYVIYNQTNNLMYFYDKNFNHQYNVFYEKNYNSGITKTGPFVVNNSVYLLGGFGIGTYSGDCGTYIAKFDYQAPEVDYTIKTEVIAGKGTIEASATKSKANEKITYKATPAENYETKSIKVITENNVEIKPTDNSFTMPEDNVIIQVEFVTKEIIEDEKNEDIKGETDKKEENPETFGGVSLIIISSLITSALILVLLQKSKYNISDL